MTGPRAGRVRAEFPALCQWCSGGYLAGDLVWADGNGGILHLACAGKSRYSADSTAAVTGKPKTTAAVSRPGSVAADVTMFDSSAGDDSAA
jgi:hypothetical protein